MKPTARTWALLVVALLLLLANVVGTGGGPAGEALPTLPAVPADRATRIELSDSVTKITLVPEDAPAADGERSWRLLSPVEARADQQMVQRLLAAFAHETTVDVRVDQGNLETYGLEAGKGVVVELWEGGELPVVSFTVGHDAPGGSSFVRLSGDDAIFRARVGGRDRFPTDASLWRNRVPLGFAAADLVGLSLSRDGIEPVVLLREGAALGGAPGRWTLDPPAAWPLDEAAIEALATRMGALRADEVLSADFDGGFAPPLVTATFSLADGSTRVLEVGRRRHPDAAFVRVQGDPAVYRVPRREVAALLGDRESARDRRLLSFAPADVDTISLEEGGRTFMVRQAGGVDRWQVVQPPGLEVDVERVVMASRSLAGLRGEAVAEGVDAAGAGLVRPSGTVTVYLVDGTGLVLELGGPTTTRDAQPARFVRSRGRPEIMVLPEATVQRIRQAFGQG